MLKFVVVIFLVIMASTFAQQCGDNVCDAGSCCVTYSQKHCKKLGQLHDMCWDPNRGTDEGNFVTTCPCEPGLVCNRNTWACHKESSRSE
uniref:U1-hexatoxin-Hi1c_2 n=1 Tax=Hadronyche infensa TaxID=153481 RepID=A0A1D0BN99_HADIN